MRINKTFIIFTIILYSLGNALNAENIKYYKKKGSCIATILQAMIYSDSITFNPKAKDLIWSNHLTSKAPRQITFMLSNLDQKKRKFSAQTISKVNNFVKSKFTIPPELTFAVPDEYDQGTGISVFNSPEILSPYRHVDKATNTTAILTRPMAEHEYSHILFEVNMLEKVKNGTLNNIYQDLLDWWSNAHLKKDLQIKIEFNKIEIKKIQNATLYAELYQQNAIYRLKLEKILKQEKYLEEQLNHLPPEILIEYEELFSDLLVFAKRKNPRAIIDVGNLSDARNPSITKNWKDWSKISDEDDYHETLAPVQHYIWKKYLKNANSSSARLNILRKVFDVIAVEVNLRMTNKKLWNLSNKRKNARLIIAINQAFK